MKKVTNFIVEKRNLILIIFVILSGVCLYLSNSVNINSDITKYLPGDSETKIGKEIMDNDFEEQKSSNLNIMFKDLTDKEKQKTLDKLSKIKGVSSVSYDNTKEYNNGKYTLYILNVDDYDHSKTAETVYNKVNEDFEFTALSGSIYAQYKPVLQVWIIVVSIAMALVILTLLSESYIEPWLYLTSIGIAVFINKGTNIIFPSVSNITDAIAAILQLALSMDYSIMLSNRYRQERSKEKNKVKAMKSALYDSFKAISSSSVTTVVGLLALVFMSFTIGRDLGFVLAKGVFLSLVSIFFCLPGLLLLFDKQIINSKKKTLHFDLTKLGIYSYRTRYVQLFFIIVAFITAYLLKGNLSIAYTGAEQDEIGKHFPSTNQIAIVYKNEYEDIIAKYCKSLEADKKAGEVLCYGNTINEKLAYNELNKKFKDLGQDTEIDEYLIKIIYYNYYNKNTGDSMTLEEFISFIKSDIFTNDKLSSSITNDVKENMDLLENFATANNVTSKRSLSEIANIIGMDEASIKDVMILYNAKHLNTQMTLNEFVNFMTNEVAMDPVYGKNIDANTLNSLKRLKPFLDISTINKKASASEIANIFGIDETMVNKLFLFSRTLENSKSTMTINEFANLALSLKDNPEYANMFNENTVKQLSLLQLLSNDTYINQEYSSEELSYILSQMNLNIDKDTLNLLYFYNYYLNNLNNGIYNTETKLSLNEFVNNILMNDTLSSLLPSSINDYKPILATFSNKDFITTNLDSTNMSNTLEPFGFDSAQIKQIYASLYIQNVNPNASMEEALNNNIITLTPYELLNIMKSILPEDNPNLVKINLLINIMDLSYNKEYNIVPTYNYLTLSNYLSSISPDVNKDTIALAYAFYDYQNTSNYKTMSIKEVINFIVKNKNDPIISSNLNNNLDLLSLGYTVVNNTNTKYTYEELSNLIGQDINTIKNIYNLADYLGLTTTMTPREFTSLILNNSKNQLLSNNLNNDTLNSLNLVNTVMNSTLNNAKYNAYELSNLLGSDASTLSLVMALYDSRYLKTNNSISLIDFTNFLISDVIHNPEYNSRIDDNARNKLNIINGVMNNTLTNTKYNSLELSTILNKLTDNLDTNLIDLVYIYHGSKNSYNDSWKLTIEEIINYLNADLLKDSKYSNFLDDEMTDKIKKATDTIKEAKNLLVTKKYSRAIINSKLPAEGKETFKFIEKAINKVGKNDGVYVIGDSPIALEISKTFNNELNFITLLTMLFIFIVVAFTFKDLLISLILVLIIQCSVFITMSILSLTGNSVYFIALLIVQAILMGATIDYAIVYTTYYKESRETMKIKEAMINAYNKSIHTILSSSSILIIVTLIVSLFAEAIPAKICETISEGTLASAILIILVLPGVLAAVDKIICKNNY